MADYLKLVLAVMLVIIAILLYYQGIAPFNMLLTFISGILIGTVIK